MKTIYLICLFILSSIQFIYSQPAQLQWSKSYGQHGFERILTLKPTLDGGYIGTGHSAPPAGSSGFPNQGEVDMWVIRLDSLYNTIWTRNYGSTGYDYSYNIVPQPDSTFITIGTVSKKDGDFDSIPEEKIFVLLKLDKDGNLISTTSISNTVIYSESINKIIESPNGFIMVGATPHPTQYDLYIVEIDFSGNIIWEKEYGGSKGDLAHCINYTNDGGYIIGGRTRSDDGDIITPYTGIPQTNPFAMSWLIKIDSIGNLLWEKRFFGEDLRAVTASNDGGYFFSANSYFLNAKIYFLTKIDSIGNIEWELSLPFNHAWNSNIFPIFQTSSGDYLIGGYQTDFGSWLQLSSDGKLLSSPYVPSDDFSSLLITLGTFHELPNGDYLLGMNYNYPFVLSLYSSSNSFTAADFDSLEMNTSKNINLLANDIKQIGDSLVINSVFDQGLGFHSITNSISILNDSVVQYIPSQNFAFDDIFKYEVIKYNNHIEIARDTNFALIYVAPPVSTSKLEIQEQNAIKVFPQPIKSQFTVAFHDKNQKIESLRLYNANMQIIRDFGKVPNYQKDCDINDLPSGSYFIIVNDLFVEKLIKL